MAATATCGCRGGGFITGLNQNIGSIKTDGVDLTFNWTTPIESYGSVAVGWTATYTNEYVTEPIPGLGTYDCAGLFGVTVRHPAAEMEVAAPGRVEYAVALERDRLRGAT